MIGWPTVLDTRASGSIILVRLLVGLVVCFTEGIQKLVLPEILGAGLFARIGIPYPELKGPIVGTIETVSGALIIVGLLIRLAAMPLIISMIVAIISTKVPIRLGHDFFDLLFAATFVLRILEHGAEACADFMLLGSL